LHCYKKISHKEGYDYFLSQLKSKYPGTNINQKYFIVYRWDSLMYDFIYKDQMKVLDSMATRYGEDKLEYIFVTEMEEKASKSFLKNNYAEYKNVKMLYGMDDFISGIYNIKGITIQKSIHVGERMPSGAYNNFKQTSFYLIMDSKGMVLHTNGNKFMVLKDSVFLEKLSVLMCDKNLKF
jgi:hypothetical protein